MSEGRTRSNHPTPMNTNCLAALCFCYHWVSNVVGTESHRETGAFMAGVKGRSGPPGNQNNFKHGLSVIDRNRRSDSLTGRESRIKAQVRDGLIADRGGENKVSTAEKVLVELISSDVAWLATIDTAIRKVLKLNKRARANPKALKQLDDYKRPIVNSLTTNLQRYGLEKIPAPTQTLEEILAESTDHDGNPTPQGSESLPHRNEL